jgi:FecR protein
MKTDLRAPVRLLLALMLSGSILAAQQSTANGNTASSDDARAAASSLPSSPSVADSQVRIVRLSEVNGEVQIDRNAGQDFEPALLNLPITQGTTLRTGAGLAEVEFEDDTTLRLTPNTVVQFSQLQLQPSGAKASTVDVQSGTVYVSLARTKGDEFNLRFDNQQVQLMPSTHARLHLGHTRARLAVLDGNVQVQQPTGTMAVGKKKTLIFSLANPTAPTLAKNVARGHYDDWDQQAIDYHKLNAKGSAYTNLPNISGISDMNYYGSFVSVPGCGQLWRPYFASATWDPFMNGTWAWYPGSGYSWVSPYPWGWTPYHYGSWEYCPTQGWGWRPGGPWIGLKNPPKPIKPPNGILPAPHPPLPPTHGTAALVAVNRTPPVASGLTSPDRFVVRTDSAGLGIPRGTFGSLSHMSGRVEQHGSSNLAVSSTPITTGAGNSRTAGAGSVAGSGRTLASRTGAASHSAGRGGASSSSSAMARASSAGEMGRTAGAGDARSGGSMGGGGGAHK